MKLVLCAVILTFVAAVQAEVDFDPESDVFSDFAQNDYDLYDYADDNNDDDDGKNIEVKEDDTDKQVEAEIQKALNNSDDDEKFDPMEDYQFEDNRSDNVDKEPVQEDNNRSDNVDKEPAQDDNSNAEPMPDDAPENLDVVPLEPSENKAPEVNSEEEDPLDFGLWGPLPVPEDKKESLEEDEEFDDDNIDNLDDKFEDDFNKMASEEEPDQAAIDQPDVGKLIDETMKLKESGDDSKADDDDSNDAKLFAELFSDDDDASSNKREILNDFNADLDKLFETLNKLSDNDSDLGQNDENVSSNDSIDEVQDYEEKNNRPYKEGNILTLRDEYENFEDDLEKSFADNNDKMPSEVNKLDNDKGITKPENANVEEINNLVPEDRPEPVVSGEDNNSNTDEFDYTGEIEKILSLNDNEDDDEKVDDIIDKLLRHSYGNDGLVDDQLPINKDAEVFSTTAAEAAPSNAAEATPTEAAEAAPPKADEAVAATTSEALTTEAEVRATKKVDDLTSSEYNELMSQFALTHSEANVNSEDFVKDIPAIHVTLSLDEPTVITSPDFPAPYPTGNTVDWIFEGPGLGIEMNITHLQVNGGVGDYLLVKPGGIDEKGTDGLVFSFRLTSERRYRFLNVNRMFVRFQANQGMQFFTGFSFSVKMIRPLREFREELPEAAPVLRPPSETLILSLAGVSMPNFHTVKPAFRVLIADMAAEYIKDNEIDPGLNTTLEVTQISRTAVCNIRWPNYETCVEVAFGVPLHYEDDDATPRLSAEELEAMWRTYIIREPFASRLSDLGITEYAIPNDSTVVMVWVAIAIGVVISMAMLAFALWRFRCFEDYTRMTAYADTDSVQNEKKNLDLYPTPHQTLPPLFTDNDYKWVDEKYDDSARVDMGGFANRSYVRDDLFDIESDEDVMTPRDRKDTISPRDVYEV